MKEISKDKNFTILTNKYFEDEVILLDTDTKEVIKYGDYYHNNILTYIDGYIQGIKDLGIKVNVKKETGQHDNFVEQE